VNADTRSAAVKSIANYIGGKGAYAKAEQRVQQIEAKHQSIASAFGTGAGLRLMRQDSDIAERIVLQLHRQGVVVLPIHDSFLIPDSTRNKGALMFCGSTFRTCGRSGGKKLQEACAYGAKACAYGAAGPPGGRALCPHGHTSAFSPCGTVRSCLPVVEWARAAILPLIGD
jgi:hypothetical protein